MLVAALPHPTHTCMFAMGTLCLHLRGRVFLDEALAPPGHRGGRTMHARQRNDSRQLETVAGPCCVTSASMDGHGSTRHVLAWRGGRSSAGSTSTMSDGFACMNPHAKHATLATGRSCCPSGSSSGRREPRSRLDCNQRGSSTRGDRHSTRADAPAADHGLVSLVKVDRAKRAARP